MNSRDFVYWLQGFMEISKCDAISKDQVACIQKHLNMVFKHEIDPSYGDEKHQEELNKIHNPAQDKDKVFKPVGKRNSFDPHALIKC